MGKTLKNIKIVFEVNTKLVERNFKALSKGVETASKKVEDANKNITNSNEEIADSNEQLAKSSKKVADTNNEVSITSKILGGTLKFLKGTLEVAASAIQTVSVSLLGATALVVKFAPLLSKLSGATAAVAVGMDNFAISMSLKVAGAMTAVRALLVKMGTSFLGVQESISGATRVVGNLSLKMTQGLFVVSAFLFKLTGTRKVAESAAKSFRGTATGLGAMLAATSKSSAVFGRLTKPLRTVGALLVPFLNRLLSLGAILPSVGFLLIGFGAKLVFDVARGLFRAAQRALEFAKSLAPIADALAKTATKLGLHVETLQQYQFAASLAGVKTEALNVGIQRFLRRTAEARRGTGVLRNEFKELGIALVDQNGFVREGADVFEDYLEAISKTKDKQEQLRLAFAAFDTEGVALVSLAKQGKEAFAAQRAEAERLGLVLSAGLLKSFEGINDQLTINVKRVEAARLRNGLFLAEMAVKWDNFKTSVKVATLELIAFLRPLEARTVTGLTQKLNETEAAIQRTSRALFSSVANLPLVTGILEVFLGGLIEDQERILEAIQIAKGEELKVAAGRPDQITEQIEEQIRLAEVRLEQQERLVTAAKLGAEVQEQVANQIVAENAARQLGIQATDAEREAIEALTVTTLEAEQAAVVFAAANRDLAAGEVIRIDTLGRITQGTQESTAALINRIRTLLLMTNASKQQLRQFDKLTATLDKSAEALRKIELELKKGAGATDQAKKKYKELSKEADGLRREVDRARKSLEKMKERLEDQADSAVTASNSFRNLGNQYGETTQDLRRYNNELDRNRQKLDATASAADNAAISIGNAGRAAQSLGPVVSGDVNDPRNVQRAINRLEAQLRQVSLAGAGPANQVQARILRAEIDRLKADLQVANAEFRQAAIQAIVESSSGLSGEAFQEEVANQLALQEELGLLPTSTTRLPGYKSMTF